MTNLIHISVSPTMLPTQLTDHSTDPSNLEQASAQGVCSNKNAINHAIEAVASLAQSKSVQIVAKVDWAMVRCTESDIPDKWHSPHLRNSPTPKV